MNAPHRIPRLVVVTGATSGIGEAVARAFARRGDRVAGAVLRAADGGSGTVVVGRRACLRWALSRLPLPPCWLQSG